MTTRPTAHGAYERLESHERDCERRYQGIREDIGDLKKEISDQRKAAWAVVLALCGFLALQVYDGLKDREMPHPAEAQAATPGSSRPAP